MKSRRLGNSLAMVIAQSCVFCILSFSAIAQEDPKSSERIADPYAVIEIGSKGVKAFVFDFEYAEETDSCHSSAEAYLVCVNPITVDPINVNAQAGQSKISDVTRAINLLSEQVRKDNFVRQERMFYVASSGVAEVSGFNEIKVEIDAFLAPKSLGTITPDQEGVYAFKGILAMLPANVRDRREREAILIDIGSGNIKFGYQSSELKDIDGFGFAYGVRTSTDIVLKGLEADQDIVTAADKWVKSEFRRSLLSTLDANSEAQGKSRIYLIGGIAWAMSNFIDPESQLNFPPIDVNDINEFNKRVRAWRPNPCDNHPAKNTNVAIRESICKAFPDNNLVVGGAMLTQIATDLDFKGKTGRIFFFRDSMFAWPYGYLKSQISTESDGP